jgi:hypothetical protein
MDVPADAPLDDPTRARALRPRLALAEHRAQAVRDLLGALQQAHHARAHALCIEPQRLTHGQPLRLVCMAPLRVSCAAGRQGSSPRCTARGRLLPWRLDQCAPPLGSNSAHAHTSARASRRPARPLALRITAAAVAQRHRAAHGSPSPHVPRFSPMRRSLHARAADSPRRSAC